MFYGSIMRGMRAPAAFLGILAVCGSPARGQCSFPAAADWKVVEIMAGMTDPSHMAVLPDGQVFAIEQWSGKVWHRTPGQPASVVGTVPTNKGRSIEDGMLGIVVDVDFATTKWLYILHTPATLGSNRLTRYTFSNGALASPKMILEYPREITAGRQEDQRHAGGGMAWNRKTRELYISTGDDTHPFGDRSVYGPRDPDNRAINALRTSANTNDLRGKCLRIKPIPFPDGQTPAAGVGATYEIPPGNIKQAFASLWPAQADKDKVRPEIYSMGHRNAYRVKTDSVTGWAFVGEVGADADDYDPAKGPPGFDKITLLKGATNAGWPFANGNLEPYLVRDYEKQYLAAGYKVGDPFKLAAIQNLSTFNTGAANLPPITVGPLIYYSAKAHQKGLSATLGGGGEAVMAGPTYDFNPALNSAVKLPPYFHRKMIFGDHVRHYIWLATLGTDGTLKALEKIRTGPNVIDMEIGPDGTLYYLDYGAGTIYSLQYIGAQKDYKQCAFIKEGCTDPKYQEYDAAANLNKPTACVTLKPTALGPEAARAEGRLKLLANLMAGQDRIRTPAWAARADIYDMGGRLVHSAATDASLTLALPAGLAGRGLLHVRFLGR